MNGKDDPMNYKKHKENELLAYLLGHAPIENFYVTCLNSSSEGVINYFDSEGRAWCLMEDDDTLAADAIIFLKAKGVPVFYDAISLKEFEKSKGI